MLIKAQFWGRFQFFFKFLEVSCAQKPFFRPTGCANVKIIMLEIQSISYPHLEMLLPLLSASYGSAVSLEDEQAYYLEDTPQDGLMALEQGKPVGYLRSFPCGPQLAVADFWLPNAKIAEALLQAYTPSADAVDRLRIDLPAHSPIADTVMAQGFDLHQSYGFYQWHEPPNESIKGVRLATAKDNFSGILDCLSHWDNLSKEHLKNLAHEGHLVIYETLGQIVSAATLSPRGEQIEIVQLATHPQHRGQSHAQHLLRGLGARVKKNMFLKVELNNSAARHVYEKVGWTLVSEKNENWYLKNV